VRNLPLATILALVLCFGLPVIASADASSEAAFLQSLAQLPEESLEEPLPGVGIPAPAAKSCTISRNCGDGNTVSCTGTYSCVHSQRGVSCNGVETACPAYCSMAWSCQACPSYTFFCSSLRGDCGVTNAGCNGQPQRCLCPLTPEYPY
jgi:hypothetical protein